MNPKSSRVLATAVLLGVAALFRGCIVGDELSTVTIHPDGSADLIKVQTNVHSSEQGTKADEELRRYVQEFDAKKSVDHVRISDAGGRVDESRWVRKEPPYANVIVGKLPSAAVFEKAFTFKGDDGKTVVAARFTQKGTRRRFSLEVTLPLEQALNSSTEKTIEQLRASQANGLSETRFAVAGGKILDARGFTVAADKQSALLEPKAIIELLKNQRQVEVFLEWEVADQ
jgi:hypothetical protein